MTEAEAEEGRPLSLYEHLDRLQWHAQGESHGTVKVWLREFLAVSRESSLADVNQAKAQARAQSSALIRYLKARDEELIDLAGEAISVLSGQGTHLQTLDFSGYTLFVNEESYAGADETLGAKIWPSALEMASLLPGIGTFLQGKRVLEIGCGPGLPGILCSKLGAEAVVLTDYVESVLKNCERNVERNGVGHNTVVQSLSWTALKESDLERHSFDVVLAADVIYDPWHGEAVPPVIDQFLRKATAREDGPGEQGHVGAAAARDAPRSVADTVAALSPSTPLVVAVLGDRRAREGIPVFEEGMAARFQSLFSSPTPDMSIYVFARHTTPHTEP